MATDMSYFESFEFKGEGNNWELILSETPLDEFFTFNAYSDALEVAESFDLGGVFEKIIPYIRSFDTYLDESRKKEIENLLIPAKECLRINEETGLISKILEVKPEWDTYFTSILNNWNKGRYLIVHYE